MPDIKTERPPYVIFETRAVEDRDASLASGVYTAKDVDFAVVTPAGSKDKIERVVTEWFEQLQQQVRENRFPDEWYRAFKSAYSAWKEDREIPENGYPIKNWPVASPAQVKSLLDLRVRTVEDLAAANEETILRLGMGGRALKQRAVDWLQSADAGKVSGEMQELRESNEALAARNQSLEEQLKALQAQVSVLAGGVTTKL